MPISSMSLLNAIGASRYPRESGDPATSGPCEAKTLDAGLTGDAPVECRGHEGLAAVSASRGSALSRWVLGLMFAACASTPAAEPPSDWFKRLEENRPLAAFHGVRQMPGMEQVAAQVGVFVGDEAASCALFGRSAFPEGVEYRDALDAIAKAASGRRVVMLNESHFRSVHRAFLLRVIERLHDEGFDALAAEALHRHAPAQLQSGRVDVTTGFYTHDPVFAAALRRAQSLGWDLVHYEAMGDGDRVARESGQARNLAEWLERNPDRRLLVCAGGSHISKVAEDGWMAARFIADTGIEPLTIQQAATACPDTADAWPVQSAAAQVVFQHDAPVLGSGDADLVVLHPPAAVDAARSVLGVPMPICVPSSERESLLRAFAPDDQDGAIPRDQVRIPAGVRTASLWLSPGRYRIERERLDGRQTLGDVTAVSGSVEGCLTPVDD